MTQPLSAVAEEEPIAFVQLFLFKSGRIATKANVPNRVVLHGLIETGREEILAAMVEKAKERKEGPKIEIAPAGAF